MDYSVQLGTRNCTDVRVSEKFLICKIGKLTDQERQNGIVVKVSKILFFTKEGRY